jgi:hypothetical protein
MADRKDDRSTWAIGGGLLLGLGVGLDGDFDTLEQKKAGIELITGISALLVSYEPPD